MTTEKTTGGILFTDLEEEMKDSYITYAMSVIVGRALPDVRDGLKPVHRRILFAMHESGMVHNKAYKKSARVVGDVLGKYHPHGDSAVYDAMTRMVQDFSLRYPLIDGQGNFGSLDGDPAAAMRYTECRMGRISSEIIRGIEKETVPFMPNYDESESEPTVLPSPLPNLLINGSTGIAVGMATNIPPHNLSEVISAFKALIDKPDLKPSDILRYIKGPDFPTGGIIYGREGIRDYFTTGRGRVVIRARTRIEPGKNDRERIIISEVPYQVNKANLIEAIATLVKAKKVEGISDIRDESDKDGVRVVIELKRGAMSQIILNQLYKHTQLQVSFGVIMLALVDNKPRVMNIVEVMKAYLSHRELMTVRALTYDLHVAERRAHILEGLKIALDNLDAVIKTIRSSPDGETARKALMKKFSLSQIQAQAILDMRLQRLTGLERNKIETEYLGLIRTIEELKSILGSRERILDVVRTELEDIGKMYGDARRTAITDKEGDFSIEDLIAEEEMVITITNGGYIKRQALSVYRKQGRGGKGITGMGTKDADFITSSFIAGSHDYILFFTDKGKVYWLKVYAIPEAGRLARGRPMINLLQVESGESITAHVPVKEFSSDRFLFMVTRNGIIKKTNLEAYSRPRAGGINGIVLDKDDRLIRAMLTDGKMDIVLATKNGQALRFGEEQCRSMGRVSRGVKGITLSEGDEVVGSAIVDLEAALLTIKSDGLGKRTRFDAYRRQGRGGKGIINIKLAEGVTVVGVMSMRDDDEFMCTTQKGIMIRTSVQAISVVGRSTKGVRIIRLNKNDIVGAIARVDMLDKKADNESGSGE